MSITSVDDVKQLGTIMCVFAHPDDETFTMGGIMAAAVRNGQQVICITATHGELGVQDETRWPQSQLGDIRQKEWETALDTLGVSERILWDYPDGSCTEADDSLASQKIAGIIELVQPDSIFTFGQDGLTGHPDHQAVSKWVSLSAGNRTVYHAVLTNEQYERTQTVDNALNFFYNTPKPPTCDEQDAAICLKLDDALLDIKKNALRAMPSQYQIMFEKFDDPTIRGCFDVEAFVNSV